MAPPANDDFADAETLTGTGGSITAVLTEATRETGEPEHPSTDGSVWYQHTTTGPSRLVVAVTDSTAAAVLELWEGDTLDDLHQAGAVDVPAGDTPELDVTLAGNSRYNLRILGTADVDATWTVAARNPAFTLTIANPDIEQTPSSVRVSVANGTPDAPVRFSLLHLPATTLWTDELDATGVLTDIAVPITVPLDAGTYQLRVTEGTGDPVEWTGQAIEDTFDVEEDSAPYPTDLPVDAAPVAVPQTGVRHWVVQDVAPGGGTYTFPHNPAEMTSPFPPRVITVETTVLHGYTDDTGYTQTGRPVSWEGATKAHQWEWKGFTADEAYLTKLTELVASNRRYYLIDHRNRAWVVTFEHLDAKPLIRPNLPWAHEYSVRCLIYAGPIQL
jgi:hypothetical protein